MYTHIYDVLCSLSASFIHFCPAKPMTTSWSPCEHYVYTYIYIYIYIYTHVHMCLLICQSFEALRYCCLPKASLR